MRNAITSFIPSKERVKTVRLLLLFGLIFLSNSVNAANKYDGAVFGADGYPTDCSSSNYLAENYSGVGRVVCLVAKKYDVAFSAFFSVGMVASTVEVKERCGFEYTKLGESGVEQQKKQYPKTWGIYMKEVGSMPGASCEMARAIWPLIFK